MPQSRSRTLSRLAGLALAAAVPAAQADWQYTHWGMSKNQVLLAADGALSDTMTRRAADPYVGLRGHYEAGPHKFDAAMLFDAGDNLTGVLLSQRTSGECVQTLGDLKAKYGAGQDLTTRRGPIEILWSDAQSSNRIKYEARDRVAPRGATGGHDIACTVRYEPFAAPSSADGL
ncbi:MAG TPA: hypothetical protein VGC30_13085 [Dokdonella sp.]